MRLQRLGTDYGGWVIPIDTIDEDSVVWCAGAGEDISFDIALIVQRGCAVHCIDPTPRAVAHVEALVASAKTGVPMPINGRPDRPYEGVTEAVMQRLHFHPIGLFDKDDVLRFYAPRNATHVSHSAVNLQGTDEYFEAPCRSPSSLMQELGQAQIDLLKLDIEGAEHVVLDHLLRERIHPRILCIEFDYAARGKRRREAIARLWKLARAGYRVAWHRDWNVTLVHDGAAPGKRRQLGWAACYAAGYLPPWGRGGA